MDRALQADQDYPVTIRLHDCVVGGACGENEYGVPGDPETPQCAAELTLTNVSEAGFELAQRLTFQPWMCAADDARGPAADRRHHPRGGVRGSVCAALLHRDAHPDLA